MAAYTDKSSRYRPCIVDGKEALFHRWMERDVVYYEYDTNTPDMMMQDTYKAFTEDHIIARGYCTLKKVREEAAIVEFKDGAVEVVEPNKIRFVDTAEIFDNFTEYFERLGESNG